MKYIKIRIPKATVYFTPVEIEKLLNKNIEITNKLLTQQTEIFKEGLKRGKCFIRSSKQKIREERKI
ncbi:hypothetical protein SAMN05444673_0443 [Bacillus sp. OV166]|uniref:hypothetical protein n=1 Tax=Bacillus sp. OV166 TaxID=1882763 RepID=UPI000A2AC6BB|nr:hypothetical protein [Bacillus sp. OV166]SMQ60944.1 hypothetical protein SAMN05444673_0443 [Bacillus sp. OV166]